jgi:hypothetical protein
MIPQNAQYYHIAYMAAVVIYGGYALTIWLRRKKVRARLAAERPASRST